MGECDRSGCDGERTGLLACLLATFSSRAAVLARVSFGVGNEDGAGPEQIRGSVGWRSTQLITVHSA